nr:helix-turn-helix transcriptional regulator [uncultured Tyzzerella sp.]
MIVENINKIRKEKKLTIKELSNISNIPFSTLNKICSNITKDPHISILLKLCKALNCDINTLCGIDNAINFQDKIIFDKLKNLNYNQKNNLINYIDNYINNRGYLIAFGGENKNINMKDNQITDKEIEEIKKDNIDLNF